MRVLGLLMLLTGCAKAAPPAPTQPPESPMQCTATLSPGQDLASAAAAGGTVCLKPGVHRAGLLLEASVTLVGEPGAVLDAAGRGPVVQVSTDDAVVVLRGLTLRGGHGELGATLRVDAWAEVTVQDCVLEAGIPAESGAAGLGVQRGSVRLVRTALPDALLTGLAEVELSECAVAGEVRLREGAKLTAHGGSLDGGVSVRGDPRKAPVLTLLGVEAEVRNHPEFPGTIVRR